MTTRDVDNYVRQIEEALATQNLSEWQLHFDVLSDTLYINFDEKAPYGISSYLSGGWMVRVDRQTNQVHGLQIENVLALEVQNFPILLDLVLLTTPVGFTPSKVEQAVRERAAAHLETAISSLRTSLPQLLKSAA